MKRNVGLLLVAVALAAIFAVGVIGELRRHDRFGQALGERPTPAQPQIEQPAVRWYTEPGQKIGSWRSCIEDHGAVSCGSFMSYTDAEWWTLTHGGKFFPKVVR